MVCLDSPSEGSLNATHFARISSPLATVKGETRNANEEAG